MTRLLGGGILLQTVVCAIVGARLLWLARRTRELPELFLGGAFLLLGGVGYPLSIVARSLQAESGTPLLGVALAAQDLASLGIYVMTWRTFRASQRWAAGLVIAAAALFAASLLGGARTGAFDEGVAYYLGFTARAGAFAWSAVEAISYHAQLRRRLPLGLADPVVVDRFRLWAWTTVSVVLGFAVFLAGRLWGVHGVLTPWVLIATSAVASVGSASMWLAFVPPRAYLERVRRRAPQPAAAGA